MQKCWRANREATKGTGGLYWPVGDCCEQLVSLISDGGK